MKRFVPFTLFAAAVTGLSSGCATVPQRDSSLDNIDAQYVSMVDRVDRSRGVLVKWVNYPQRKSTAPVVVEPVQPTGT